MAHDVDVGERQNNRKPVMIEFFPHVKPFVFSHEICTANNHVNE